MEVKDLVLWGTTKLRNENETKRNEMKRNETKRKMKKRKETFYLFYIIIVAAFIYRDLVIVLFH